MGLTENAASEVIRISLGRDTTEQEMLITADEINKITEVS
jgi:cysteine sulfinate desulfinase/cysteine desulfurase-like protein